MHVTDGFSEEPKREKEKGKQVTLQIKSKIEKKTKTFSVLKKEKIP